MCAREAGVSIVANASRSPLQSLNFDLHRLRIIIRDALDQFLVHWPIANQEAVAGEVGFIWRDGELAHRGRRVAEEGLRRVKSHRLREAEAVGAAEDGQTGWFPIYFAANVAP